MKIQDKYSTVKINNIEIILFIFSMVFIGEINGIDIRILIDFFWMIYALIKRVKLSILFSKKELHLVFAVAIVLFYSSLVMFFSSNFSAFYVLKILRCIISTIVIFLFFSNSDITFLRLMRAYIIATSIQVLAIFGGFASLQIRDLLTIFSGYSKKYLPFRSGGLFSGYDYAGYFVNIAIFLYGLSLVKSIKKNYFHYLILLFFMMSVILTSRFNSIILVVDLVILLVISFVNGNKISKIYFTIISVLTSFIGIAFIVISTNISPSLKDTLINKIPALSVITGTMTDSYANYNVSDTIAGQFIFPQGSALIFGQNIKAPVDPGYVNTLYYIGLIGLVLVIGTYSYIAILGLNKNKMTENIILIYIYLITLIFEVKLSFIFSSGAFEVFIIFWCIIVLSNKNRNGRL